MVAATGLLTTQVTTVLEGDYSEIGVNEISSYDSGVSNQDTANGDTLK